MSDGALEQYSKIISIESTPSTGNLKVAEYCASLCTKMGFKVELQEATVDGKKNANLIARPKKSNPDKGEVVFQTHLDTVEPGPMGRWTKTGNNAFNATVEGDRIYGLGTADVKLDFICKLRALSNYLGADFRHPFVLVGTYAEEIGMLGATHLLESGEVNGRLAIIGEPSELQVCYANNGMVVLEFDIPFSIEELDHFKKYANQSNVVTQEKIFHGKAAHSSTPALGENAILKLIDYLEKMPAGVGIWKASGGSAINTVPPEASVEIDAQVVFTSSAGVRLTKVVRELQRLQREMESHSHPAFSPPHPTLNVATLKTVNTGFILMVSLRITPSVTAAVVRDWILAAQEHINALGGNCTVLRKTNAAQTSLDSDLVKGCLEISKGLGLRDTPITKAGGTESSIYSPSDIDCIVFGPGVSVGNSHTANEYNLLPQLDQAQLFYRKCVERFCL